MRVLRRISGVNRWLQWQNHIKNEDIRRKMNVVSIQERVSENNLRWFGHLCRMDSDRLGREIFIYLFKIITAAHQPNVYNLK